MWSAMKFFIPRPQIASIESPLGKTLLRHHVGDVVHVDTELGGYDLKILSITPDDTDDEIRSF